LEEVWEVEEIVDFDLVVEVYEEGSVRDIGDAFVCDCFQVV